MSPINRIEKLEKRAAQLAAQENEAAQVELSIERFCGNITAMATHGRTGPDGSCPPGWRPDGAICHSPPAMAYDRDLRTWRPCTVAWDAHAGEWVGDAHLDDDLGMWVVS